MQHVVHDIVASGRTVHDVEQCRGESVRMGGAEGGGETARVGARDGRKKGGKERRKWRVSERWTSTDAHGS